MARKRGSVGKTPNTWEDMEHDEVDQFHEQREKILLGEDDDNYQDNGASDEEVLAVHEADESDDDNSEVEYDDADEESDAAIEESPKKKPSAKSKAKNKHSADVVNDDEDDDDWRGIKQKYIEEDELSGWGQSARSYYNADQIEDEEDAKEEEEAALKIQQKSLAEMHASDFLDDFEEQMKDSKILQDEDFLVSVKEVLPEQDISKLSQPEKLELLRSRNPEIFPLSKEFTDLVSIYNSMKNTQETDTDSRTASVKFVALSSYLACISAYFALFCDDNYDEDVLRDNKVMNHLLVLRRYWKKLSQLPDSALVAETSTSPPGLVFSDDANEELEEDDEELESDSDHESDSFEAIQSASTTTGKRKLGQRTTSLNADLDLDLDVSTVPLSKKKKLSKPTFTSNDFADASVLDDADLSDKLTKRKTLRFYTSKIDQKSQIRKEKFSGDVDLPYREREKERQSRLSQLAALRGASKAVEGDEDYLDGSELPADDEEISQPKKFADGDGDSEDDYYDMVKSSKEQKKADIEELRNTVKKAARDGKLKELEKDISQDGKRAVTYQILKNKGLTPKRNKDNRNPRVKKRKKYEKAKKKLASMKPVYKKPEGPYSGEKTGIKKNVTKSTKFR